MLDVKKLIAKVLSVIKGQGELEVSATGTLTLYNCTGTISHNQLYFMKLKSGLWFINGRVNINNFTRTGANPGFTVELPSSVPTPKATFSECCGFRAQSPREYVSASFSADSRTAYFSTTESYLNAQNGTLTFIMHAIIALGN